MLRKRSRSIQKDQYKGHLMSDSASENPDVLGQKLKSGSFFSVPGLFVGFSSKGLLDSDSARSPTSTLDYKVFANLGNPFRSPRASPDGPHKSWDCSKVGLGILDSLKDEAKPSGKGLGTSESKSILFGSQMRMNNPSSPNHLYCSIDSSLPKIPAVSPSTQIECPRLQLGSSENVLGARETRLEPGPLGKLRSSLSDSSRSASSLNSLTYINTNLNSEDYWATKGTVQVGSPLVMSGGSSFDNSLVVKPSSLPVSFGSGIGIVGSLSACEIEQSEDYTCVISHGANPRTTHIFGDRILECHDLVSCKKEEKVIELSLEVKCSDGSVLYPSDGFLSYCYTCKKKLEQGKDIYMYRGEKAFCSSSCRLQEIFVEEKMEKTVDNSSECSPDCTYPEEIFLEGMVVRL
ncbi:FCS-Like Zinc finger 10-like [Macadamia integrifolia]|uniref:FCS-Like Zinc finger 10-like n=1 Tax=Macadamia integrifolia TaxID=60698 RepID=UPI001C4FD09A|nr:FCS-Like Zinc finger 10-like [Macadamia integrifolia]